MSDWHPICPHFITIDPNIQVMRKNDHQLVKFVIVKEILLLSTIEMYGEYYS